MHRTLAVLSSMIVICVGLIGCADSPPDNTLPVPTATVPHELTVYGPVGIKAAFEALQSLFNTGDWPYQIRVFEGTSTESGLRGVFDGTFDVMFLMRRPEPHEPLVFVEFARTPVGIFVHPDVGISNLSRAQVAAIFSGAVTNWSEVGGADQEIVVILQEQDDTTTEVIREDIMGGDAYVTGAPILIKEIDVLVVVEGTPGAVGYAALAGKFYHEIVSHTEFLDPVTIDGIAPTDPNYELFTALGIAFLPERTSFLEPLFVWAKEVIAQTTVRILIERMGLQLMTDWQIILP